MATANSGNGQVRGFGACGRLRRLGGIAATVVLAGVACGQVTSPAGKEGDNPWVTDMSVLPSWATPATDRNAALNYWSAISSLKKEVRDALSDVDWDEVKGFDPSQFPEKFTKASKALGESGWLGSEVLIGSRLKKCDFEVRYEEGLGVLLPHLGHLRALARAVRVEARTLAAAGKNDEAAAYLAAGLRMVRHSTNDRIVISSLVGIAIDSLLQSEIEAMLDADRLSPAAKKELLQAYASITDEDPFMTKAAIRTERDVFLGWAKVQAAQGPQGVRALKEFSSQGLDEEAAKKLGEASDKDMVQDVEKVRAWYDEAIKVWDAPDAPDQLRNLTRRCEAGGFGFFGKLMIPPMEKVWASEHKELGKIRAVVERLSK